MPRKSRLGRDDAISILRKYIDYFKTPEFPEYSATIWKDLAQETEGIWTRHCWWVNVTKDRRQILSTVREQLGVKIDEPVRKIDAKEAQLDEDETQFEELETWFDLVLTKEMWDSIKPVPTDSTNVKNSYQFLRPKVWTNIIADQFFKQHALPCAFSFTRNQVSLARTRRSYLKIEGYCRADSCNNYFHGYLDDEPSPNDEKIIIRVQTRNTSREIHQDVKRYLNGEKRKQLGKDCHEQGTSNLLKKLKSENMGARDVEGPSLPTADVLRHAKFEHVNRKLGIEKRKTPQDAVERIFELQFEKEFMGSIHGVGYYPFYTIYGLPEQLSLYRQYCNLMQNWSCISIEGTGSSVRELFHKSGVKTGHIFLHCIVIRFDKELVSVFQMLSESQEAETFTFWLAIWVDLVKKKPNQCTTDYSRARLTGCCKAFNNISIKEYQNLMFLAIVSGDISRVKLIVTYLRVDVAHLIKMIRGWKATKEIHRRDARDFAIRCVALMVDCQDLQEFKEIFSLTCIVLFHEYEDTMTNCNCQIITVKDAKRKLESYMSERRRHIDDYAKTMDAEDESEVPIFEADEITGISNQEIFIMKLVTQTQLIIHEGTEKNSFRALAFFNQLVTLAKEFILWTAVGMPFFFGHGSSCGSGKKIHDSKSQVFGEYAKEIGAEEFLRIHVKDLTATTRRMASKLTYCEAQGFKVPEIKFKSFSPSPDDLSGILSDSDSRNGSHCSEENDNFELLSDDPDSVSREDWKGETSTGVFDQCDQDDTEAERVPNEVVIEFEDDDECEGELKWLCKICNEMFSFDIIENHKCK